MSVCKYYLNGNCRYGDGCRFMHPMNNTRPSHHHHHQQFQPRHHHQPRQFRPQRPPLDPRFSFVAAADTRNNVPQRPQLFQEAIQWARANFSNSELALDILQQLQKEARVWLKSGSFWRFTSRSIFPSGEPLPNWQDFSFEEVRWEFYMRRAAGQEHHYKRACTEYWEATERQLLGLSRLAIDVLNVFKPYIEQCIQMNYHPTKTLDTDVDMESSAGTQTQFPSMMMTSNATAAAVPSMAHQGQPPVNYTLDDSLLDDERVAFNSDAFEFGKIPMQAPSMKFS